MKNIVISTILLVLVLVFSANAFGQKATRIKFARGATSATVSGGLTGYRDEKVYVIKVRAGQTIRTAQVGTSHQITIYIENPDGEEVGDLDASCNNRREITATEAGDYHIRVVECQKADRWRGTFKLKVSVR